MAKRAGIKFATFAIGELQGKCVNFTISSLR